MLLKLAEDAAVCVVVVVFRAANPRCPVQPHVRLGGGAVPVRNEVKIVTKSGEERWVTVPSFHGGKTRAG